VCVCVVSFSALFASLKAKTKQNDDRPHLRILVRSTTTGTEQSVAPARSHWAARDWTCFSIVAAATTGWMFVETTHIGLYYTCSGSFCVSTLELFSNLPKFRELQVSGPRCARLYCAGYSLYLSAAASCGPPVAELLSFIPWLVDVAIAAASLVFLTLTWTIAAGMLRKCICDNVPSGTSCALNYSWALAFIAWCFVLAATVIVYVTKGSMDNSAVTTIDAPPVHRSSHDANIIPE
jgi:hypothetical protein